MAITNSWHVQKFQISKQPCSNEQNPVSSQTMNIVVVGAPSVGSYTYMVYICKMLLCTYNVYIYICYVCIRVKSAFVRTTKSTLELRSAHYSDLYCLPNIVRVTKSRTMRWAVHVARMEERRGVYRVWVGKPKGKRSLGRP